MGLEGRLDGPLLQPDILMGIAVALAMRWRTTLFNLSRVHWRNCF